jgi:hypothetical protein
MPALVITWPLCQGAVGVRCCLPVGWCSLGVIGRDCFAVQRASLFGFTTCEAERLSFFRTLVMRLTDAVHCNRQ